MKYYLYTALIFSLTFFGCSSKSEENYNTNTPSEVSAGHEIENASPTPANETENPSFQATYEKADYQEFYESGQLKIEGNYDQNEQRHGLWVSYYDNGQKWSESSYKNGLKHGHSITFFPNGNVRYVGEYKEDEKSGTWTFYNEEGEVTQEETY